MAKTFDDIFCLVCNTQLSADKKGNYACPCCGMTYKSKILKDKRIDRIKEMISLRLKGDFDNSSVISTQLNQVHKDYTVMSKWNNYICSIRVILNADGVFAVSLAESKPNLDNLRYQEFLRDAMKNDKTFCGSAILIHDKLKEFFDKLVSEEKPKEIVEEIISPTVSQTEESEVERYNSVDVVDDVIDDELIDDDVDDVDVVSTNDIIVNVNADDTIVEDQSNNVVVDDVDGADVLPVDSTLADSSESASEDQGIDIVGVSSADTETIDVVNSNDTDVNGETISDFFENSDNSATDEQNDTSDISIEIDQYTVEDEFDIDELSDGDFGESETLTTETEEEKIADSKLENGKVLDVFADTEEAPTPAEDESESLSASVDSIDDELTVDNDLAEENVDEKQSDELQVEEQSLENIDDKEENDITTESVVEENEELDSQDTLVDDISVSELDNQVADSEIDSQEDENQAVNEISVETQLDEELALDELDVESPTTSEEAELDDIDVQETVLEETEVNSTEYTNSDELDLDIQNSVSDTYSADEDSNEELVTELDIDSEEPMNENEIDVDSSDEIEQNQTENVTIETLDEELSDLDTDEESVEDQVTETTDLTEETVVDNNDVDVENTNVDILDIAETKIKSDVLETRKEGVEIIKEQSKQGVERAMYLYGYCWENGICLIKNPKNALSWYKKALENGYSSAESDVSRLEEILANKEPKATKPKISKSKNYLAEGIRCYNEKDYENACALFKNACAKKDPLAYFFYAVCCEYGLGCQKNPEDAFKYYGLAVKSGNENALFYLAQCYQKGFGCEKNSSLALKYYKKSAETGNAKAEYKISRCYKLGDGVEKNLKTAFKWALTSAEHGNLDAVNDVAWYYVSGNGVKKDYENAVKWYKIASDKCDANAMFNLAICFEQGYGVEKNEEEALKLYKKSSKLGNESAKKRLKVLKK